MIQHSSHEEKRERWGTRLGFICAAMGSAVGLGNIWRFPYIAGENGGAAFILIYLVCIIGCGLPIMLGELVMGRAAQTDAVGAYDKLAQSRVWSVGGMLGVIAGFFILSFYSVVAGWAAKYFFLALGGSLLHLDSSGTDYGNFFGSYSK